MNETPIPGTSLELILSANQILPFLSALHILIYLAGYGRLTLCYDYYSGQNANGRVAPFCSLQSKMLKILNGLITWSHVSFYLYLQLLLILLSLIGLITLVGCTLVVSQIPVLWTIPATLIGQHPSQMAVSGIST